MTEKAGKCILVLGMHRSGTSCLAGTLQQHGVHLGKVFEQNPYNKKGNRENAAIMKLNDDLLKANGGSWDNPPLEIHWNKEQAASRDAIISTFLESQSEFWGFKDPRNLITFDFWMDGLEDINVKLVGSYRDPLLVAKSLHARNKLPMDKALRLWEIYNKKLIDLYETASFPMISFDIDVEEYKHAIDWILNTLQIPPNENITELFFDESLRHTEATDVAASLEIPDTTRAFYQTLNEIYKGQKV
jgi:hypothetical protein